MVSLILFFIVMCTCFFAADMSNRGNKKAEKVGYALCLIFTIGFIVSATMGL